MKAISKKWSPESKLDTPYKRAQQEWDSRMGSAVVHAKNWRLATFFTLIFVAMPSIAGMIYLGAQPKSVPHIVDLRHDGSAQYRGAVSRSWEQYTPDSASIVYHLHRFVHNTRTLSSDPAVIKNNWFDAYKLVTPSGANILNQYASQDDPFGRAKTLRVSVDVGTTNPISKDTWQIDWKESSWGPKGNFLGDTFWRGIFKVTLVKPDSEADLSKNPLGLFIDEFNWSKIHR